MAERSSSKREILRELERRSKLAVAAKGRVAKKSSAPPRRSAPIPTAPAVAPVKKSSPPLPTLPCSVSVRRSPRREHVRPTPLPSSTAPAATPMKNPSPPPPSSAAQPIKKSSTASESIKIGTQVRVKKPPIQLRTGERLVILQVHSAVVVSVDEPGFVEVIYNGNFPHDDPFRTVRIPRERIMVIPNSPAPAATTTSSPS